MGEYIDINSLPLRCLPSKTRELLSCLLDTQKIIPSDGPDKLPRDWRGLASLANVSSETAAYIQTRPHKTMEVLLIWQKDPTATVGKLLSFLQHLDRHDVYDDLSHDLRESVKKGELLANKQKQVALNNVLEKESTAITHHDGPGYEQQYDAFVLYAEEDRRFVDELIYRMTAAGFQLCTEDELLAGHMTPYAPIAQLILERCKRIILVCSPEFLSSAANTFYRDYAQAVSINSQNHKIIPIMYRDCQLPPHLAFYHKLYYNEDERAIIDFWQKLGHCLELARGYRQPIAARPNVAVAMPPQPQIFVELPPSSLLQDLDDNLFITSSPRCNSMNDLDSLSVRGMRSDSNSLSNFSQQSASSEEKKKKPSKLTRVLNTLKLKKPKKTIMVAH